MIFRIILDLLFPKHCVGCKKEGAYLCLSCERTLRPRVEMTTKRELEIISCFSYEEKSPLAKLIHLWKYDGIMEIENHLKNLLSVGFSSIVTVFEKSLQDKMFCPVPLHRKRERWRGFNQAERLAKPLLDLLGSSKYSRYEVKIESLLTRIINTQPQAELSREKRLTNVIGAFEIKKLDIETKMIRPKHIVLVDDVLATGATLQECALTLRKHFPQAKISAFVLAKPR